MDTTTKRKKPSSPKKWIQGSTTKRKMSTYNLAPTSASAQGEGGARKALLEILTSTRNGAIRRANMIEALMKQLEKPHLGPYKASAELGKRSQEALLDLIAGERDAALGRLEEMEVLVKQLGEPQYDIFHLFEKLPTELRLQIWEDALPEEPRFIEIYSDQKYFTPAWAPRCRSKVPIIFLACKESHGVVLKHYSKLMAPSDSYLSEGAVYINYARDYIYLGNNFLLGTRFSSLPGAFKTKKILNLALGIEHEDGLVPGARHGISRHEFKNLQDVLVGIDNRVSESSSDLYDHCLRHREMPFGTCGGYIDSFQPNDFPRDVDRRNLEFVEGHFEKLKRNKPSRAIPKITMVEYTDDKFFEYH